MSRNNAEKALLFRIYIKVEIVSPPIMYDKNYS